jgi:2-O-methyltransferase
MDKTILYQIIKTDLPTIFEIGAHHGEDSEHFARMLPKANLFMFEPDQRCIQEIQRLGWRGRLIQKAVSDTDGNELFYPSKTINGKFNHDGSGSILKPKEHLTIFTDVGFGEPYIVPTVTLDNFCMMNHIYRINFVWMDVQGAEAKVFRGGEMIFRAGVEYVFTEYDNVELYEGAPTQQAILDMLKVYEIMEDFPGGACGDMLLRNTLFKDGERI